MSPRKLTKKKNSSKRLKMALLYVKVPQTLHDEAQRIADLEGSSLAAVARRWIAAGRSGELACL